MTNLVVELKYRRDNKFKKLERIQDYNALICFFITDFYYKDIF